MKKTSEEMRVIVGRGRSGFFAHEVAASAADFIVKNMIKHGAPTPYLVTPELFTGSVFAGSRQAVLASLGGYEIEFHGMTPVNVACFCAWSNRRLTLSSDTRKAAEKAAADGRAAGEFIHEDTLTGGVPF